MRTTTRRSERAAALAALLALAGCAQTEPGELLRLSPESAANQAMQTRRFDTSGERELLSASAAVLQDLGFQVTESEPDVGFLRATKERSAREYGQELTRGLVLALSVALSVAGRGNALVLMPVDLHQQINASLVARPVDAHGRRHEVRVLFYRLVWRSDGQSGDLYIPPGEQKMQMIRDAGIYQQFFARLAKAVFLEAHRI